MIGENMVRKSNGITLIALVVTVIVILILAAIVIGLASGKDGVLNQAENSSVQYTIGKEKEYLKLAFTNLEMDYR